MLRLYTYLTESWKVTKENTQDNKKQLQKESFKVTVHTLKVSVLDNTFIKLGKKKPGVFTGLQNFLGLTPGKTLERLQVELFRVKNVLPSRKQVRPESKQQTDRQTDRRYSAQRQNVVV